MLHMLRGIPIEHPQPGLGNEYHIQSGGSRVCLPHRVQLAGLASRVVIGVEVNFCPDAVDEALPRVNWGGPEEAIQLIGADGPWRDPQTTKLEALE
jgi:hypothetical protein